MSKESSDKEVVGDIAERVQNAIERASVLSRQLSNVREERDELRQILANKEEELQTAKCNEEELREKMKGLQDSFRKLERQLSDETQEKKLLEETLEWAKHSHFVEIKEIREKYDSKLAEEKKKFTKKEEIMKADFSWTQSQLSLAKKDCSTLRKKLRELMKTDEKGDSDLKVLQENLNKLEKILTVEGSGSAPPSPEKTLSPVQAVVMVEHHPERDTVIIEEVSPDGEYVKLKNVSNKDLNLNLWNIYQYAGPKMSRYTFGSHLLKAGNSTQLFSTGSNAPINPPDSLMVGHRWHTASYMITLLSDRSGKKVHLKESSGRRIIRRADPVTFDEIVEAPVQ